MIGRRFHPAQQFDQLQRVVFPVLSANLRRDHLLDERWSNRPDRVDDAERNGPTSDPCPAWDFLIETSARARDRLLNDLLADRRDATSLVALENLHVELSSSFLIATDSVGWLTKHASPPGRSAARGNRDDDFNSVSSLGPIRAMDSIGFCYTYGAIRHKECPHQGGSVSRFRCKHRPPLAHTP